jgi:hypothetical protein
MLRRGLDAERLHEMPRRLVEPDSQPGLAMHVSCRNPGLAPLSQGLALSTASRVQEGLLVAVLIVSWGIMDRNMNQASNTKVLPQMALHWSKPDR